MLTLSPRQWRRVLWLIGCTALAGCAARPVARYTGAPVYAVDLTGGARQCAASRPQLTDGRVTAATMRVANDGGWCAISVQRDGNPYDAGLLTGLPAHGRVFIHPVGPVTRIDYTPDPGFSGTDRFVVQLIPGNPVIRTTVIVTR